MANHGPSYGLSREINRKVNKNYFYKKFDCRKTFENETFHDATFLNI